MVRTSCFSSAALALAVLAGTMQPAAAGTVVYCKSVGVPKGCVARKTTTVVVAPAPVVVAPAPVVVAPRATGVVVAPGRVGNRGGPVNRVGRR